MDSSILFDIEERPLRVDKKYVSNKKAIINRQTDQVISVVSKSYKPISNRTLLNHFCDILDQAHISYSLAGGHLIGGGTKTAIEIILPREQITLKEGDLVSMKVILVNSFDGRSSAKLIFVFVRLVCMNGMTIGEEVIVCYRHIGNVNQKIVEEFTLRVGQEREAFLSYVERLQALTFPDLQSMEYIIRESAWLRVTYRESLLEEVRKVPLFNAWWLYNVFTYVISHFVRQNVFARLQLMNRLNQEAAHWRLKS